MRILGAITTDEGGIPDPGTNPSTAAVVPVGGPTPLLDGCLEALGQQVSPLGEVILVDDSPSGTLQAPSGVRVVRSAGRGPYAARNVGWRASSAEIILFVDVRNRPRPGWSKSVVEPFADSGVALVGADVLVRDGSSLAAHAAALQQVFRLDSYLTNGFAKPYLPTCNLVARRADLEAVDGFAEVRSGADADLCWRILELPGRRLEPVHELLVEWIPRERKRDYIEQNYRYGKSHLALRSAWSLGDRQDPSTSTRRARRLLTVAREAATPEPGRNRRDAASELLAAAGRLAFRAGLKRAARSADASGSAAGGLGFSARSSSAEGQ